MSVRRPADLPERNVELLRDTMKWIEEHPGEHDQERWVNACGTAFCYAGHAALLAGATRPDALGFGIHWGINPVTFKSVTDTYTGLLATDNIPVDEFAARQLGITFEESEVLFDGDRTTAELRALVDALCAGAWIDDDRIYDVVIDGVEGSSCHVDVWLDGVGG